MCTTNHNSTSGPKTAVTAPPPPPVPQVRGSVLDDDTFDNPLNDSSLTLPQSNAAGIATAQEFSLKRDFSIFVPKQLATDFANAPTGSKPKARLCLLFGTGREMELFRLNDFFASESNSVLINIPGVETGWSGIFSAFGYGISTQIINDLMTLAGLSGIDFTVEVMGGYSTGYRGLNQTIINQLVDLTHLKRIMYLDAWYHHDDHPVSGSGPYNKKNTKWAIDTALGQSPGANVVIYAFTPGGVPRSSTSTNQSLPNPPAEPIPPLIAQYPGQIQFIDFNFKFNTRPAIDDQLEKICLGRLIQLSIGGKLPSSAAVPAPLMNLINALPSRGALGTFGLPGFTDLYEWVSGHTSELSGFSTTQAMSLIVRKSLLDDWTDSSHFEMRHRTFLIELGKEPLLPS